MPRLIAAAVVLAAQALLSPGKALAGPPEGASGRIVFDQVEDGLRKYRAEKTPERRAARLTRLAATQDPRATLALGEAFMGDNPQELALAGIRAVGTYYTRLPPEKRSDNVYAYINARAWWKESEADLRRRAAQLPR